MELARRIGIPKDQLDSIRRGVLLHDIGKMAIPDAILLKADKLTDEEWTIMRNHPVYAYNLLSPIPYLRASLDIPYAHHEHWDGSGYPRGLAGEAIPLAARMFSVVDVWDALTSDRPYREAWSEERVKDYILSLSGIQFDPKIVELFMQLMNDPDVSHLAGKRHSDLESGKNVP
jgi:HD-GYP domain-containing protein (c-di-GMP phosphodiesterase class II)